LTVRETLAAWVKMPDIPLTATGNTPVGDVEGMVRVTVWGLPAVMMNGEAGEVVDPEGNPERVIVTAPAKPF
jgi:hypothetical protein